MVPRGWQGALLPVILLLAVQARLSVADCEWDDLNDYSEHIEAVYDEATNKDTYKENETAQYMCQGGFYPRAAGSQFRTAVCRNGRWDKSGQSPLNCMGQLPQGCVEPSFPHGRIIGMNHHRLGNVVYHNFEATVIFDCDDGQRASAKCLQSGNWSSEPPACTVLTSASCGNPFPGGIVSNGRPDSLVFSFPTIIKITCNPGYRLVAHDGSEWGTKILQCQSNAQWNRPAPKCMQVVCPPSRDIPHGRVIHTPAVGALYENATATYQCNGKNYVLKGTAVRRCQNSGTWSDQEPVCQGFDGCVKPDLPNGRILALAVKAEMLGNISYYPYDTTIIFDCDDHRQRTSSKCQQSGNWSPEPPTCSEMKTTSSSTTTTTTTTTTTVAPVTQCSPLSSPTSGKLFSVDGFRINASVVFSCDEGYTMRGPSTLTCRPGGAWDPPTTPTCTAPPPWIIILSVCLAVLASLVLCCLGAFYIMRRRRRRTPPAQGYRRQIRKPGPYDAISNDEVARLGKPLPVTSL